MRWQASGADWLLIDVPGPLAGDVAALPFSEGARPVEDDEPCLLVVPSAQAADLLLAAYARDLLVRDPSRRLALLGPHRRYAPLQLGLGRTYAPFHVTPTVAALAGAAADIGLLAGYSTKHRVRICDPGALEALLRLHQAGVLDDPAGGC